MEGITFEKEHFSECSKSRYTCCTNPGFESSPNCIMLMQHSKLFPRQVCLAAGAEF